MHCDTMMRFNLVVPIGKFPGLMPAVAVFTTQAPEDGLTDAGFAIDYEWQPGNGKAVFIVARKRQQSRSWVRFRSRESANGTP